MRHDAPREMLQRTTVLTRREMETTVPSTLAPWTTVLIVPAQGTTVLDVLTSKDHTPVLPEEGAVKMLIYPTRTGYGLSSLNDDGMATPLRAENC